MNKFEKLGLLFFIVGINGFFHENEISVFGFIKFFSYFLTWIFGGILFIVGKYKKGE